jgi:peptidoglycan-associated lipoprotein
MLNCRRKEVSMRTQLRFLELCGLLGLIVLAATCHKRVPAAATTPAPAASEAPPPPGPPTCTITTAPAAVTAGQSVTLTWSTNNATTIDLKPGLGSQQAEGSTSVTPAESTTYTLSLAGAGGSGECSARVTVTPATPPSASVQESNIAAGGAAAGASPFEDAFFDFNASDLSPSDQTALTHDADYLKSHPDMKIRIGGYCDQRGSEEYNLGLGQRRAEAAKQFIVNLGVSADNIVTVSYGKDRPFCTETTEECYQKNRRAHLEAISGTQ